MRLFARKVNNYDLYALHAWYVPGVKGMFGLLGWLLVGTLLGGLVQGVFGLFVSQKALMDYGMLVSYPLMFLPGMVYVAGKSQRNSLFEPGYKLSSSHWGPYKGWQVALLCVAVTFAFMMAGDLPNYLNYRLTTTSPTLNKMYEQVVALLNQMTGGPFWSTFLVTAVFAPVFEEWLCRGMVLRGLLTRIRPGWAIVVSALFFALIHFNPWQALNAFLMGLIMGYVYYRTGSLWLTMLIHFVNNGTAVVLAHVSDLPQDTYWIQLMDRTTYGLVYILSLVVLGACLLAIRRIPLEQSRGNIDAVELKAD